MWSASGAIWVETCYFRALKAIDQLPNDKVSKVVDFASFILKRHEEQTLQKGIEQLVESSAAFAFLREKEDLYTLDDLKERY